MKKRNIANTIILGILIIGLIVAGYFLYVYSSTCEDDECLKQALVNCKRTSAIKDDEQTAMLYEIIGKKGRECKVNVKLLQIKTGSADLAVLENKEMDCYIPLGTYVAPEENLKNCHGLLKEAIQEIMIQRMHAQLIENIGEISSETTQIL